MAQKKIGAVGDSAGPTLFSDTADEFGSEVAEGLQKHFAGHDLRIPEKPSVRHRVAVALGYEVARRLGEFVNGELLYVPRLKTRQVERDMFIADAVANGFSDTQIAEWLGVTRRAVSNHVVRLGFRGKARIPTGKTLAEVSAAVDVFHKQGKTLGEQAMETMPPQERRVNVNTASDELDELLLRRGEAFIPLWYATQRQMIDDKLPRHAAIRRLGLTAQQFALLRSRQRHHKTIVPVDPEAFLSFQLVLQSVEREARRSEAPKRRTARARRMKDRQPHKPAAATFPSKRSPLSA